MSEGIHSAYDLQEACAETLRLHGWRLVRAVQLDGLPNSGRLAVDIQATHVDVGRRILVLPRWQANNGTAEEKIPFQMIKVQMALETHPNAANSAYFVLEGAGWRWRDYFLGNQLSRWLSLPVPTKCLSLKDFGELASRQSL